MGHRRKAREYALQALYMYEVGKAPLDEITTLSWLDSDISKDIRDFTVDLVTGTIDNIEKIDEIIQQHSKNWKIERLSLVDKAILRLSIYAMIHMADIPTVVTIDEGIELGKLYGGENSGQFINGILDSIKNSLIKK